MLCRSASSQFPLRRSNLPTIYHVSSVCVDGPNRSENGRCGSHGSQQQTQCIHALKTQCATIAVGTIGHSGYPWLDVTVDSIGYPGLATSQTEPKRPIPAQRH